MKKFNIKKSELEEILSDTKLYIEKLQYDTDVSKFWFRIKELSETLNKIIAQKNIWEYSDDELLQKFLIQKEKLDLLIKKTFFFSKDSDKIQELDKIFYDEKDKLQKLQRPEEKRIIIQYYRPHYDHQTCSIQYLNYYYDAEGYLVEIHNDGVLERKDIRLADFNIKTK